MRYRHLLSCLVVFVLASGMRLEAKDIRLVTAGKSDYTIVLSENASPSERHAASELQEFLKEISHAELPITTEGRKLPRHMILVGDSGALRSLHVPIDFQFLGDEGFTIRSAGLNLIIAGGRLRGTMYGVYTFLEDILGCRWYTSYVSRIPHEPDIIIQPLNIVQKPDFEYREPYYAGALDGDWAARNKVNGSHQQLDEARGGKITYGRFGHSMDELVPMDKYYKDHPEYYALVNGKRTGGIEGQLCLTNPDVVRVATATLLGWIKQNPEAKIWSVSQNDNTNRCQCDNCMAVEKQEGSPSGPMIRFVNQVAAEVHKTYPNVLIDTFAYQYTEKPPKLTKPGPNVCVRLCPIDNCQYHPYATCVWDAPFMENLRGWSKLTDDLYIWHYTTDFYNYLMPFPDLDEIEADIPLYKQSGVRGIFTEGTYNAGNGPAGGAGFMDDLKAYLIAKLLWNAHVDSGAVVSDFLNGYFGKAGKPIGQFLSMLQEKVRKENIHGYVFDGPNVALFTPEIMSQSEALFDEAEKVADNEDVLHRVRHARLSLEYVDVMLEVQRCSLNVSPAEKSAALARLKDFANRCKADGIIRWSEGTPLDDCLRSLSAGL